MQSTLSGSDASPSSATQAELLADRLAWTIVARTSPWDCTDRLRHLTDPAGRSAQLPDEGQAGSKGSNAKALRAALARVDAALHAQGHHSRPHYATLLSMQKARCSFWSPVTYSVSFDAKTGGRAPCPSGFDLVSAAGKARE